MQDTFRRIAQKISKLVGSSYTFILAVLVITLWAVSGPAFNYSNTWQLFINTTTTVLTFLMVFLIQNTQNRDAHALHLKLDELIRASKSARNKLLDIEDMEDEELDMLAEEFKKLREQYRQKHQAIEEERSRRSRS